MIDLSINEAESLLTKAGRGAGLDWGLAAELAAQVLALQSDQPHALGAYCDWLESGQADSLTAQHQSPLSFLNLESGATISQHHASPQRPQLSPALYARLYALLMRTTVPESLESRQGGAGAGISDND